MTAFLLQDFHLLPNNTCVQDVWLHAKHFLSRKGGHVAKVKDFPLIWQSFTNSSGFYSTVLTDWNTHLAKPRWPCLGYQSLKTSQCKGAVRTFSLHLHPPQLPWCAVQLFSATFTQVTVLERSVTVFALFSSLSYFVSQGIIYLHSLKIAPGVNPEYKGILFSNSVRRFSGSDLGVSFSIQTKTALKNPFFHLFHTKRYSPHRLS